MDTAVKIAAIFGGLASIIAVGTSVWVVKLAASLQQQNEQYANSSEIYANFAKVYYESYPFLNEMVDKYGVTNLRSKLTLAERQTYDQNISNLNIVLAQIYVIAPDDVYEKLTAKWSDGNQSYKDWGEQILVMLRLMNHRDTKYSTRGDIKMFFYR